VNLVIWFASAGAIRHPRGSAFADPWSVKRPASDHGASDGAPRVCRSTGSCYEGRHPADDRTPCRGRAVRRGLIGEVAGAEGSDARRSTDVRSRSLPALLPACTVARSRAKRVSLRVLTVTASPTIQPEGNYNDRMSRCDEETTMSVILLILFIAVMLVVHEGMLHRFGSPYR
jgi:hypothetical protein